MVSCEAGMTIKFCVLSAWQSGEGETVSLDQLGWRRTAPGGEEGSAWGDGSGGAVAATILQRACHYTLQVRGLCCFGFLCVPVCLSSGRPHPPHCPLDGWKALRSSLVIVSSPVWWFRLCAAGSQGIVIVIIVEHPTPTPDPPPLDVDPPPYDPQTQEPVMWWGTLAAFTLSQRALVGIFNQTTRFEPKISLPSQNSRCLCPFTGTGRTKAVCIALRLTWWRSSSWIERLMCFTPSNTSARPGLLSFPPW